MEDAAAAASANLAKKVKDNIRNYTSSPGWTIADSSHPTKSLLADEQEQVEAQRGLEVEADAIDASNQQQEMAVRKQRRRRGSVPNVSMADTKEVAEQSVLGLTKAASNSSASKSRSNAEDQQTDFWKQMHSFGGSGQNTPMRDQGATPLSDQQQSIEDLSSLSSSANIFYSEATDLIRVSINFLRDASYPAETPTSWCLSLCVSSVLLSASQCASQCDVSLPVCLLPLSVLLSASQCALLITCTCCCDET